MLSPYFWGFLRFLDSPSDIQRVFPVTESLQGVLDIDTIRPAPPAPVFTSPDLWMTPPKKRYIIKAYDIYIYIVVYIYSNK